MLDRLAQIPALQQPVATTTPEQAALEYTRVVLQLAPPYASLFLDEDAMLNGPHAERAEITYRHFGFEILPEWRAGHADHLGVELHFLAYLVERDEPAGRAFLTEQMLTWAPVCLLAISRIQPARLYPALANVTLDALLALR